MELCLAFIAIITLIDSAPTGSATDQRVLRYAPSLLRLSDSIAPVE